MGYSINKNGLYESWSPLFRFDNLEMLNLSEQLPIPGNRKLKVAKNLGEETIDISNYLTDLLNNNTPYKELEILKNILLEIEDTGYTQIYANPEIDNRLFTHIFKQLQQHEEYQPTEAVKDASLRNSIVSKIGLIVQDLENRTHSYTAVDISDIKPDEATARVLSMINPATKFIMQVQNMVGKDVIGISAVGMKSFYTLTYYYNEMLRQNKLRYITFQKTFNRIQNRYSESKNTKLQQKIKEQRDKTKKKIADLIKSSFTEEDFNEDLILSDSKIPINNTIKIFKIIPIQEKSKIIQWKRVGTVSHFPPQKRTQIKSIRREKTKM